MQEEVFDMHSFLNLNGLWETAMVYLIWHNHRIYEYGGDRMPSNAEIAKDTIEQFKKIQRYMAVAKKEEAKETYAVLKE